MGKGSAKAIFREDPYLIPGYAGHVPQYRFTVGGTYAQLTQDLYNQPAWNSKQTVLSSSGIADLPKDIVRESRRTLKSQPPLSMGERIYREDMKSGYSGFVPWSADKCGRPFPIQSLMSVAEFERNRRENELQRKNLGIMVDLQSGKLNPDHVSGCVQIPPKVLRYGAPLDRVQPNPDPYLPLHQRLYNISVYDMDNNDPNKYVVAGFSGHVPIIQEMCGHTNQDVTHKALNRFREGRPFFRPEKGKDKLVTVKTAKVPVPAKPQPRPRATTYYNAEEEEGKELRPLKSTEFPMKLGLIPNYAGHMPGFIHLCGMTFGESTKELVRQNCPNPLSEHQAAPKDDVYTAINSSHFPYFTKKITEMPKKITH